MTKIYLNNLIRRNLELSWHVCLTLMLFTTIGVGTLSAQVNAYQFSQSAGSFTSISGGTVLGTATANSGAIPSLDTTSFPVTLPFGFVFNGQSYTNLTVSTNGYITFGTGTATTTSPISSTIAWDGVISAWGRSVNAIFDIAGKTGNISWKTEGTAPNRVAIIQWENVRPVSSTSTSNVYVFSFQIKLAETTGVISTSYSAGSYLVGSTVAVSSAANQIGLRGATNTDYNNRFNPATVAFDSSVSGTSNSDGQAFNSIVNPPGMPADGLTYTWTPPTCLGPTTLAVSNITTNSVTLSWNASVSAPANGYDIYYNTSNVAPVATTTPTITGVTGLTQNIIGLNPSSAYFVWVRAVCSSSDASNWIALPTFNTACASINDMFENFDSYTIGNIVPNCWDRIVSGTGTQSISSTGPLSTPNGIYQSSSSTANQTIVVLPVFGNINAGTHWVRMTAKVNSAPRDIEFGYVTNTTDANSFVLLETKSITNTVYTSPDAVYTFVVPTSVPSNARLAIKNPGIVSTVLYYDDVYWEPAPTCLPPANVSATSVSATTATVTWTASTTIPANGYEVYYSTSNTPPVATTTPNITGINGTTTILTGLTPSTQYFAWVRSSCTAGDISTWSARTSFNTACQPPAITGTTGATVCPNSTATLSATADAGATIHWYDAAGTELATGSSFTTPSLAATTTYYTSASVGTSNVPVGKTTYSASPSSGAGTTNFGLVFDVISASTLSSVTIYPVSATGASGTVIIDVIDENGVILQTHTENVVGAPTSAPVAHIVNLNFSLLPGTNYKIRPRSYAGISGLLFDPSANAPSGNYGYPFSLAGVLTINTSTLSANPGNLARNDLYYYFYDWKISSKCESAQQPVVATVDPACLSTSEVTKDDVKIYPNPFTDFINISDVKGLLSITVNDVSGRIVKTIAKPSSQINLSELNSGMYILTLRYKDGNVKTVKVIKK